jgi:hypothetical protein
MKRFLVALTALVACTAIAMATVSTTAGAAGDHAAQVAKKKKKKKKKAKNVATSISLTVQNTPASTYSPGSATYSGLGSAGGPSGCRSGRTVTIANNGAPVATTTTDANGNYSVTQGAAAAPGTYTASVPAKVVKKGKKGKKGKKKKGKKKKFICSAATSGPVPVQEAVDRKSRFRSRPATRGAVFFCGR